MSENPIPRSRITRKRRNIVDGPAREPSCIPRQLRNMPGRKTQRNLDDGDSYLHLRNGPYIVFNDGIAVLDPRPAGKATPLTAVAYRFLELYLKRQPFWWAVHTLHLPVDAAGDLSIGLKKTQSFKIYEELSRYAHGGPRAP
jgi:hypothetical protein